MKHRVAFLFGAGAEISFKLIDGQNFAFDLFKYLITKSNYSDLEFNKDSGNDIYLNQIF